ncbi:MAG TPA: GspH/FimT family protein [Longimicrobiaceae bacterium]|nr:GspH/FimT family protein [Longimicrobiaceae bacterium]
MTTPPSSPRRSTAGFSLLELMVVLLLVMIMASVAAPRMNTMAAKQKTQGAVGQLSADLAYARVLAVRWGRPTSVRFAASGTEYTVTVDTAGTASPNFRTVKRVQLGRDYAGVRLTPPAAQVSFDTRGIVKAGGGTFTIAGATMTDTLNLNATGRTYRDR